MVLLKGDRTVVATPGRYGVGESDRYAGAGHAPGPGTCWPGCWCRCSRPGLPADRAAIAAAFVHGLAGRQAAARFGAARLAPVTAPDVAAALPDGDRELGARTG